MEWNDAERLRILAKTNLLDTSNEEAYDRFTKLASAILSVPVSLVSLVDQDRQYFKSQIGLPEPWASQQQTPLSHSFCQFVVASREPLVVSDAREEPLLKDNLAIPELGVIAYLGFPLIVNGQALGSFCAIDTHPRTWSQREIDVVRELAQFVTTEIVLRLEIAERQKIANLLSESYARFHALANQAPIMIWQMDAGKGATFFNTTWSIFTGLSEQESLGTGWTAAIYPDDREATLKTWQQALLTNLPFHSEFRLVRADGAICEVISHSSIYTDQQGTSGRSIGTMLDVSMQREAERQREASISMATHELKAPLTGARGFLQLAQRYLKRLTKQLPGVTTEQQTLLTQVSKMQERSLESLQAQIRLLDDLLDLSRVQAKKIDYHLTVCDLVEITRQTVQDQQMTSPHHLLTFTSPEEGSLVVLADTQRVKQVLTNYITNAFKYSPPEQAVDVGVSRQGAFAYVWVRDHGIGLSPEQLTHIWERFYQTKETPSQIETPGLGLGLSICQMLIREQGGEVGVESSKGEGSTFWFTLPLSTA